MSDNQIDSGENDLAIMFYDSSNDIKLTEICLSSNAWITRKCENSIEVITGYGLGNWTSDQTIVSIYFHVKNSAKSDLYVKCKVPGGKSTLMFSLGHCSRVITVEENHYKWVSIGKFRIIGSGYVKLDMRGVEKSGSYFADVSHLMFVDKYNQDVDFIREINSNETYWSRRGPSVHLFYQFEANTTDEYYYNEVTVPNGFDAIGSYFMAIGFNHGYFGTQVNSETERRILFSVWSPQKTDDPNELLDENIVRLIGKSDDIECNVFGDEGCGGQSICRYMWSTDVTYKFLVRGRPDPSSNNHSLYTAWFASPPDSTWKLIATFRRPKSSQYLSGFYSFVENFDENTGFVTRMARFGNQWICNSNGIWREVTRAKLTGDSTAKNKVRLDFEGGVEASDSCQQFYLKNCGFFKGKSQLDTEFTRNNSRAEPNIYFNQLLP